VCEECINEYVTNNFYIYAEEWWEIWGILKC
jgi:hypothetical protein